VPTLELLLPGLLGPVKDRDAVAAILPELPALARLLARADAHRAEAVDPEIEAGRAFGLDDARGHLAAIARAGEADGADPADDAWLRADPVHLRIDMTHARLFGPAMLDLQADEARALVATLNEHLAADDLRIEAPAPGRWYIRLASMPDLRTHAPNTVAGRNIDHFLPTGADGKHWRGRMNEVQMLLHEHPVNEAREAAGRLPVNSVWVWGAGRAPATIPTVPDHVLADEPVTRGLARLAGQVPEPLPETLEGSQTERGHTLLADTSLVDPLVHGEAEAWLAGLQEAEARWLAPALQQLESGELDHIILRTGGPYRFTLTRLGVRWRFWRRQGAWTRWMEPEQTPEVDT